MSDKEYEKDGFLGGVDELQELLQEDIPVTPMRFFQLFVGNENNFEKEYHEARGDTDVKVTAWSPHEKFGITRNVYYTLKLSGPIGPPTTRTEELHRYHLQKDKLIIDTSMSMLDAPYGDYFRVESQWIIVLRDDQKSSNVKISAKAVFSKSTIMKSTISSRTLTGMTESFKFWLGKARDVVAQKSGGASTASSSGSSPSKSASTTAVGSSGLTTSTGSSSTGSNISSSNSSNARASGWLAAVGGRETLNTVLLFTNVLVNLLLALALLKYLARN